MKRRHAALAAALIAAVMPAAAAVASSTPVGTLPKGPTTSIAVRAGKTFTVRLPNPILAGRVWRIARAFDGGVVSQVGEGATAREVWVRFKALRSGSTRIVFAMTRGETAHAYAARTFKVVASP